MDSLINTDQNDLPQIDPAKNYLEDLVGDGKKFKTNEDLAKGKYLADLMVEHKNREYDLLRSDFLKLKEQYDAEQSLKEMIDQMNSNQQQNNRQHTPAADDLNKPAYDPEEIRSLISSQIEETETRKAEANNFRLVQDKLKEQYGEDYSASLKTQLKELGMTVQELDELARRSPKVAIRSLGLDQPKQTETFDAPLRSNQRSSFTPNTPKRTWSYYENLRKTDPHLYSNPKTQVQMFNDRIALGDAFKDGNYNI